MMFRQGNLLRITRLQHITDRAAVKLYHQIQDAVLVIVPDIGPLPARQSLWTSKKDKGD